ncbi:MAG: histidine triad nucleotide-binding protein [Chloroflexi bacterium]|jgi:histidine triad (HIT) family protein|nr:histidine triad nucleotide-binding protein [Chloroflexota bacterium]BCY18583.1 histidine triad nucleotide-binding protein [Leptolinea sp. HRD-7]
MAAPCIFCEIITGKLPGDIVFQNETVTAFRDRYPRAPIHILIVPNKHLESINSVTAADKELMGDLILIARKLATDLGISETGYRLVVNTGPDSGQSVQHLHIHLLGGNKMPLMGG